MLCVCKTVFSCDLSILVETFHNYVAPAWQKLSKTFNLTANCALRNYIIVHIIHISLEQEAVSSLENIIHFVIREKHVYFFVV